MINILKFISCAHFTTNECIIRRAYGNRDIKYISVISFHENFQYRPYDELEESIRELKQHNCDDINMEQSKENFTSENNSQTLSSLINVIEKYISDCKHKMKKFENEMKRKRNLKKDKTLKKSNIVKTNEKYKCLCIKNIEKTMDNIYDLKMKQLPIIEQKIKSVNVPIEIENIIFKFLNLFDNFISIYKMKRRFLTVTSSNNYRIKIINYNVELFSIFNNIPIIKTLEKMKTELRLYAYEKFCFRYVVNEILILLETKLRKLKTRSEHAIENYEKLKQLYLYK
ncbi:uncharacterized protein VNE69_01199 [Vairimorpha necatrix]|uniref:Uncharacterized protein n=1 Tax=Vairimorpha necatrix TaxID=6039 RepID=A0AAX4J8M4_9MICR